MLDSGQQHSGVSLSGDLIAAGSVLGALFGWLPYIAALLGIIWYIVQFLESPLWKRWCGRRKLARLERLEREHDTRALLIARLRGELKGDP